MLWQQAISPQLLRKLCRLNATYLLPSSLHTIAAWLLASTKVVSMFDVLSQAVDAPYFFQCMWLVLITNGPLRAPALNYLVRRMPRLSVEEGTIIIIIICLGSKWCPRGWLIEGIERIIEARCGNQFILAWDFVISTTFYLCSTLRYRKYARRWRVTYGAGLCGHTRRLPNVSAARGFRAISAKCTLKKHVSVIFLVGIQENGRAPI